MVQFNYPCLIKFSKFFHAAGAVLLFVISIIKFAQFNFQTTEFILTIYYIFFGILIILVELGLGRVLDNFHFMRFAFGKMLFAIFMAGITFTLSYWLQAIVSVFFMIAAVFFGMIGCCYYKEEKEIAEDHPGSEPKSKENPDQRAKV